MQKKRVAFVSTTHNAEDDRIFYHFADTLLNSGYEVGIFFSNSHVVKNVNKITIRGFQGAQLSKSKKVKLFIELLDEFNPDLIICSEPLAIIAAVKYRNKSIKKVKIIYDITEWYPSKKNLSHKESIVKPLVFLTLLIFNLYAAFRTDAFIFGEYYKSLPFRILFPFKLHKIIGYYPNLSYIHYKPAIPIGSKICLGYTGKLSREKGLKNFINVILQLKKNKINSTIKVKIIGWFPSQQEKQEFITTIENLSNVEIEVIESIPYLKYSEALQEIDVFFDLREVDIENTHCLPIKLFYYAACGRPIIYSDLKAIRKDIDVHEFGYLVDPTNAENIATIVQRYIDQPALYSKHSLRARQLSEENYNWSAIQPQFLEFIHSFLAEN